MILQKLSYLLMGQTPLYTIDYLQDLPAVSNFQFKELLLTLCAVCV